MKKVFSLLLATSVFLSSQAQLSFGAKAGINIAKEKYSSSVYTTGSHVFFCGGVFANYGFARNMAGRIEFLYSQEGTTEKYISSGTTVVSGTTTITRLNIPLLFQYKLPLGFYAETGPQFGLLLSAKGRYTNGDFDFKSNTKSLLVSWCVGAGYQLSQYVPGLGIGARYAPGLSATNKGTVNASSIKSSVINISVFYAFTPKSKGKTVQH